MGYIAPWLHLRMRMGAVLPCAYAAKLPSAYGPMALRATATPQFGHCGLALICCSGPCGSRHGLYSPVVALAHAHGSSAAMRIRGQTAIGLWPYGPKGHSHTAVWPLW